MIVKRYGKRVQQVQPNFDARAMNEIGFTRTGDFLTSAEELATEYEKGTEHELTATAEGPVQDEAEAALLRSLEEQLRSLEASVGDGGLLAVENEQGRDYPKTRGTQSTHVVQGENRLYFRFTVDPPLRIGVYTRRS